ncbi:hypothetical protein IFM89_029032 [Coptis chinensis]|uniref:ABC transporter domain-containing protein n=1 Tax=Coptis chinensis TaxID=261450 RepID=A0A835MA38_9MAGN|nr:hypothetical protein IFM89_029032 [Coptis chinensis]
MGTNSDSLQDHLIVAVEELDPKLKFRVRDLKKVSDAGVTILRGVSVDIPKGMIVGVIGPSGSGTVADNIRYGPQLRGEKVPDIEVSRLLTLVDLDSSFTTKNGNELSVGQAQRVALARTLANDPEVLLLDEPTSALDPISTQNIEDAIVKLKKKNDLTTIIVSHSVKQIQRIADIVCLLVDGEIVEVLKPEHLSEAKHPMAQRFIELSS